MTCPINGDTHKYFLFKTYDTYEPLIIVGAEVQLYEKVEYGVLGCNCGSVRKTKIKEQS